MGWGCGAEEASRTELGTPPPHLLPQATVSISLMPLAGQLAKIVGGRRDWKDVYKLLQEIIDLCI